MNSATDRKPLEAKVVLTIFYFKSFSVVINLTFIIDLLESLKNDRFYLGALILSNQPNFKTMITLLATRHSETDDNANGIIQGQKDSKLSENGFQQVQKLSKSLKDKKIHKIYSSDLSRCGIMTVAIAEYHPECKIVYTTKLRERSLGEFEGQERAVYRKYLADNGLNRVDFEPKDGESFRKFYARCKEFLEELKEEYKDVKEDLNILLSTHSGVIICLHLILNGFEIDELEEKGIHPENASVTVFEILCGSQASVPESLDVQLPSSAGTEACDPHKFPIKKAG